MTRQETLLDLAERCEAATGPSRELDAAVAAELGWTDVRFNAPRGGYWEHDPADSLLALRPVPQWTSSLDAALTLVPEGHIHAVFWPDDQCRVQMWRRLGSYAGFGVDVPEALCATYPLALTAASLRAHASTQGKQDNG